jgi:hypothetical protein
MRVSFARNINVNGGEQSCHSGKDLGSCLRALSSRFIVTGRFYLSFSVDACATWVNLLLTTSSAPSPDILKIVAVV